MRRASLLAAALGLAASAGAEVVTLRVKEGRWDNPDCASSRSCDLREVRFKARDYKVLVEGAYSYGTAFSAHYRTDSTAALESYGFVQWIQGCQFESQVKDGRVEIRYLTSRYFFDGSIPYRHPRMVFDSVDTDPFYNSIAEYPRHYLYQWNRVPGSIEKRSRVLFGQQVPPQPELYVTDYPGTAFMIEGEARNISLRFKTCVYRTADVPVSARPDDPEPAGALECFEWESSHVFNHALGRFEVHDGLHPACEVPIGAEPAPEPPAWSTWSFPARIPSHLLDPSFDGDSRPISR